MSGRNTQICCCGASTWTAVFGWIQAVVSVLAVIGSAVILAAIDDSTIDPDDQDIAYGVTVAILVIYVVDAALGIMLIIGNKREKVKLLWIWLILTAVTNGISVIMGIVSATTGDSTQIVSVCISAAITAFIVYCVYKRIQDIKVNQANNGGGQYGA